MSIRNLRQKLQSENLDPARRARIENRIQYKQDQRQRNRESQQPLQRPQQPQMAPPLQSPQPYQSWEQGQATALGVTQPAMTQNYHDRMLRIPSYRPAPPMQNGIGNSQQMQDIYAQKSNYQSQALPQRGMPQQSMEEQANMYGQAIPAGIQQRFPQMAPYMQRFSNNGNGNGLL